MYVLSIALRHLRTRRISWIAMAIIVLIVVLYLLIIAVLEGFKEHYMDALRSVQAHMTARVGNLPWGILRPERWAAVLREDPEIRGVTIGLEIPVIALFDRGRTIGTLRGVDLEREWQYGRLGEILQPKSLKRFEPLKGKGRMPGCIIGGYWRKIYGLKTGDYVTFLFTDEEGDPRAVQFHVQGFFDGKDDYLENGAYVDRTFLAKKLGYAGFAKTLSLWVEGDPNRTDLNAIRDRVRKKLYATMRADPRVRRVDARTPDKPPLEATLKVETWQEKNGNLYYAITRENLYMRFIMGVFLFFVAIIIMLILGQLVAEKIRDIGVLRAMGATPGGITACFLAQGLIIALAGLLLGLPLALAFIAHVNEISTFFGIDPFPQKEFLMGYIPTKVLPHDLVLICVLTLGAGFFGALLPALRASRLNPVECLRHE